MKLFIIGVQKTGTSALSKWFSDNKEVDHNIGLKDVHFLSTKFNNKNFDKESLLSQYYKSIQSYKSCLVYIGVNYWMDANAVKKILDDEFKVLLILRNPIERTISAYNYFHKKGEITQSLGDICKKHASSGYDPHKIIRGSMYSHFLNNYPKRVRNEIIFAKYESLRNEQVKSLTKICDLLGISYRNDLLHEVNKSGEINIFLQKILKNRFSAFIKKTIYEKFFDQETRKKIYFKYRDLYITEKRPPVSKEAIKYLSYVFADEVKKYDELDDYLS